MVEYKMGTEKLCKIADSARNKLVELQTQSNKFGLRLKIIGGGCSGLSYQMEMSDTPTKSDFLVERENAKVIIDTKSALFVSGCELIYSNDLQHAGFKLLNPNAKTTCGCGESFSA